MKSSKLLPKTIDPSTREEILNVAQKVFADVGFKEATIRQICKAAKANVSLVSYYFGGKEELYKAIFERVGIERVEKVESFLKPEALPQSAEEFKARLQLFIEKIYNEIASKPDFAKLMHRELADGLPRAEEVITTYMDQCRTGFSKFIEYGQKKKFIRGDIDAYLASMFVINAFLGFLNQQTRSSLFFKGYQLKELPEHIKKVVTTVFFEGVLR